MSEGSAGARNRPPPPESHHAPEGEEEDHYNVTCTNFHPHSGTRSRERPGAQVGSVQPTGPGRIAAQVNGGCAWGPPQESLRDRSGFARCKFALISLVACLPACQTSRALRSDKRHPCLLHSSPNCVQLGCVRVTLTSLVRSGVASIAFQHSIAVAPWSDRRWVGFLFRPWV